VWAAHNKRREIFVGGPTVQAIEGNKLAPGLLDLYLARTCYDGQQTDQPASPGRPNNLFEPVSDDHGAHGIFDDQAQDYSAQVWQTTHRSWLLAGLGAALVTCGVLIGKRRSS
jgi:hypothetical protein